MFLASKDQKMQQFVNFAIVVMGVIAAISAGIIGYEQPLLLGIGLVGLILAVLSFVHIDVTIVAFFIILLTNTATIAVKFHGVPFIIGAAFPLLLFFPLLNYIIFKRERVVIIPMMIFLLGLAFVEIVGSLFAVRIDVAVEELFTFVVEGIAIYVLVINVIRSEKTLKRVILAIMVSTIILGIFPIFQQITGTFDNDYWGYAQIPGRGFTTSESLIGEETQERLAGAIGEKNRFAQIMLLLTMICVPQIVSSPSWQGRSLALVASVIGFAAMILPFSRGNAVGFVLMLIIGVFLRFISIRQLLTIVLLAVIMLFLFPQYSSRLLSLQDSFSWIAGNAGDSEVDGATRGRATTMLAALIVFSENPIIGAGPGQYVYLSQDVANDLGLRYFSGGREAHNLYLDVAANTGIIGLFCLMSIITLSIKQLMDTRNRWQEERPDIAGIATGLALALIAYATTGIFLHFSYIRYFWVIVAVANTVPLVANKIQRLNTNVSEPIKQLKV